MLYNGGKESDKSNSFSDKEGEGMKHKKHKKIGRPVGSRDKKHKKRTSAFFKHKRRYWKISELGRENRAIKKIKQPISHKSPKPIPEVFPQPNEFDKSNSLLKSYKFLGYCKCDTIISTKDLISKLIYVCPICDKKARIKTLKEALNLTRIDRRDDKDEIHHHIDTLPLNDSTIDPRDFKVI